MRWRTNQIVIPPGNDLDEVWPLFIFHVKQDSLKNERRSTMHSLCIINTLIQSSLFESKVAEQKVSADVAGHAFFQYNKNSVLQHPVMIS